VVYDVWGPGTRLPTLLIAKAFRQSGVDNTGYDTTSILKVIEDRFHLQPLGSRDAKVESLKTAIKVGAPAK
jgi:phospholipase C